MRTKRRARRFCGSVCSRPSPACSLLPFRMLSVCLVCNSLESASRHEEGGTRRVLPAPLWGAAHGRRPPPVSLLFCNHGVPHPRRRRRRRACGPGSWPGRQAAERPAMPQGPCQLSSRRGPCRCSRACTDTPLLLRLQRAVAARVAAPLSRPSPTETTPSTSEQLAWLVGDPMRALTGGQAGGRWSRMAGRRTPAPPRPPPLQAPPRCPS